MKSVKSEDLFKDLQGNSEDFTSNHEGFHDELDELNRKLRSVASDLCSDLWAQLRVQLSIEHTLHYSSEQESGTVKSRLYKRQSI